MTEMRKMTADEDRAFRAVRARLTGMVGAQSKAYYAEAAFAVKPVAAPGLGTWACDKNWRLYVDPSHLPGGEAGWTVEQCTEVFEHELNHLLRDHQIRMEVHGGKARNHNAANLATDAEINDDLDPEGFIAEIGILPSKLGFDNNLTAEVYYDLLMQQAEQEQQDGDSGDDSEGGDGDSGQSQGQPNGMPQANCGSGSGGDPIEGELDADDDSIAKGKTDGEAKIIRRAVAEAVKQHEAQHGRGTVPGGLSSWADKELAPPTVPWQRLLGAAVRRGVRVAAGNTDHSYARMSRRASNYRGFAIPAMVSQKPRIATILDTSGSMSDGMVHEALSEVDGIAKQMGCTGDELTLIQVDAAVGSIKPWTTAKSLELTGRGGTDMRVGFEAAFEMQNKPNVVICLTDGETPWVSEKPYGVTVIVGIIGDENRRAWAVEAAKNDMPWATIVEVGAK